MPEAQQAADEDARDYFEVHRLRYEWLLGALRRNLPEMHGEEKLRILDVGQSYLTRLIREAYPRAAVDTLNQYDDVRYRERDRHFIFDLNEVARRDAWPEIGRYHAIVLAEVIEHLHTAPQLVLRFFAAALFDGGRLIVQTPNAASAAKRLMLLAGRHPYEPLRIEGGGHFREYTVKELASLAEAAGLRVAEVSVRNYFRPRRRTTRTLVRLAGLLPPRLREGITMCLEKA